MREIREQIAFYKARRKTFQYGTFERLPVPADKLTHKIIWLSRGEQGAVAGFFQTQAGSGEEPDTLRIPGFDPQTLYRIGTRPQRLFVKRFGGLVKHIAPVTLNPAGFILRTVNRHYALTDCVETYQCRGDALAAGIMLNNQFMGSYYNDKTRLLGDYGSSLYIVS
jgi:alpha-galactosidase